MKRWIVLPIFVAALVLSACAQAGKETSVRSINVAGVGTVRVRPDIVRVSLGVQTRNEAIAQAVAENNQAATRVLGVIREYGVAEEDAQTSSFYVYTQQRVDESGNPIEGSIYVVDNTLTITLKEPAKLGDLLKAAVAAGANNIYGVNFDINDPSQPIEEARKKAIVDARTRAETMATAAGVTLGDPIRISTSVSGPGTGPVFEYGAGYGGGAPVTIASGTMEVQAQVTVSFAIR